MRKQGWWVPTPGAPAVVKRIARPVRSLVLRFVRELRGFEKGELAERTGLKLSTIEALERGRGKYEPGEGHLERLLAALGVSPAILEEILALAEEVREEQVEDIWLGPVRISGARLRRTRQFGRKMGNLERRNFEEYIFRSQVEETAARDRETA